MTPQQEIDDLKRRIDETGRATRYYPPIYPPGYTPPPTAPYQNPNQPWPYDPWRTPSPWWEHQPTIVYCAVMH